MIPSFPRGWNLWSRIWSWRQCSDVKYWHPSRWSSSNQ